MRLMAMIVSAALLAAAMPGAAQAQYRGDAYRSPAYDRGYDRGADRPRGYDAPASGYRPSYRDQRRGRCDRGTGGTIIGAIAGGLLGNTVAGRGDRGFGTIIGAGAGALTGRAIDRDC